MTHAIRILAILFLTFFTVYSAEAQLGSRNVIGECDLCEPTDLALADFDGDGLVDVVVAYYTGPIDLVWLKNLGEDGFDEPQMLIESSSRALKVETADLDNDGDQDIIVGSIFSSKVEYLLNDGLGNFTDPIYLTFVSNPSLLGLADLNDDGFIDFFSSGPGLDHVEVSYNDNGNGFVQDSIAAVKGSRVYQAVDLDQDGDLDLVGASSRFVQWLENTGSGFAEREILLSYSSNSFVSALQVYDMDDDGDLDFLMAHSSDRIYSSKNNGDGSFSSPQIEATSISLVPELLVLDLENDQDLDVLFSSPTSNNNENSALISMRNYADNLLDFPLRNYEGEFHRGLEIYDLDGDGDEEVFSVFRSGEMFYYENHSFSNKLSVRFFSDHNGDGIKQNGEEWIQKNYASISPAPVEIVETNSGSYIYTTEERLYSIFVPIDECFELSKGEAFTQVDFDTIDNVELIYGLTFSDNLLSALDLNLVAIPSTCDGELNFQLVIENEGCLFDGDLPTSINSMFQLFLNDKIESISTDAWPLISTDEYITFEPSLADGTENLIINITIELIDDVDYDEPFPLTVFGTAFLDGTLTVFDSVFHIAKPFCLSDGSKKFTSPARGGPNYTLKSEEIVYTILFQNESDLALTNVEIRDDLSEHLDINSLEIISSTFPVNSIIKQINSNSVRFIMNSVSLPPAEEDYEASFGFIEFRIDSKFVSGNKVPVKNRALIYAGNQEYVNTFFVTNTLVDAFLCEEGITDQGIPIVPLTYEYSVVDSICQGEEATLSIDFMEGFQPYIVDGTEVSGSNYEVNLSAGSYQVTLSDSGNCLDSLELNIVEPEVNIEYEVENTSCENTADGSISVTVSGNSGPYITKQNGASYDTILDNLDQDDYFMVVDDSWGCVYVDQIFVEGPDKINLHTNTMDATGQNGMNGVIYIDSITGGTAPYIISWENMEFTDSLTNLAPGTYSLTITDSSGCVYDFEIEIKFVIATVDTESIENIDYYPNPFTADIYIQCSGTNCEIESLRIYDSSFRLMTSMNTNGSKIHILSDAFPQKGMYFIEVQSQESKHWLKVLKQ